MLHAGTQTIQTERLVLRPLKAEDAEDAWRNWVTDPMVTRYLTWQPHERIEDTRALFARWAQDADRMDCYRWVITVNGEAIGLIDVVHSWELPPRAEIGYAIGQAFWGKGYTTEALRAVIAFLFTHTGYKMIRATHHLKNPASGRVMQKAGMRDEGMLPDYYHDAWGVMQDVKVYGISKEEWEKQ